MTTTYQCLFLVVETKCDGIRWSLREEEGALGNGGARELSRADARICVCCVGDCLERFLSLFRRRQNIQNTRKTFQKYRIVDGWRIAKKAAMELTMVVGGLQKRQGSHTD